jgi:pimeloyl-ACP methyl ester carboxylesterase
MAVGSSELPREAAAVDAPRALRDYGAERLAWEANLTRFRAAGDRRATARTLRNLGHVARRQGDDAAARAFFGECLTIQRDLEDTNGECGLTLSLSITLLNLGDLAREQGDGAAARARYSESMELARALGDEGLTALAAQQLGIESEGPAKPVPWSSRLVDVGGHRLYTRSQGTGAPTVVLESGLGGAWDEWRGVPSEVARFALVVCYSRAGAVGSEPGPVPRTTQRIADDLRALLARAGIAPPYVLVAHSYGCLPTRLYAIQHPDEVAGIVLMDGPHEDLLPPQLEYFSRLSPEQRAEEERRFYGGNEEHVNLAESQRQLAGVGPLPPVPLVYINSQWLCRRWPPPPSAPPPQKRDLEAARAAAIHRYGPQTRFVVAERSGHMIAADQPEVVVDATRSVIEAARQRA